MFSPGWQVKFGYLAGLSGWAIWLGYLVSIRGERAAKYRYSKSDIQAGDGAYADVYANTNTGAILRIVFHGFDTPGHVASYQCSDSAAN